MASGGASILMGLTGGRALRLLSLAPGADSNLIQVVVIVFVGVFVYLVSLRCFASGELGILKRK